MSSADAPVTSDAPTPSAEKRNTRRSGGHWTTMWLIVALLMFGVFVMAALLAPERLPDSNLDMRWAKPWEMFPFGADGSGRSYLPYVLQGASIVLGPAVLAGVMVMLFSALAGLARCAGVSWLDTALQVFSEIAGALPRMVVVLVVAFVVPKEYVSLYPLAIAWAILAAPGAMDEAAAAAGRLGGARFVEALRAHGFSVFRIYLYHVTWLNLRSVLMRQGAEILMQVVFLEIALSYLADFKQQKALTRQEMIESWAGPLNDGFRSAITFGETWGAEGLSDAIEMGITGSDARLHALVLGLVLVALVALMAQAFRLAARER